MLSWSSIKKSAGAAIILSAAGSLFGMGFRYGLNFVIARGFGASEVGIFSFGLVVIKASSILARGGLDSAVQKYIPIYQNNRYWEKMSGLLLFAFGFPLVLGTVISFLIYVLVSSGGLPIEDQFLENIDYFLLGIPLFTLMMVGMSTARGFKIVKYSVYSREIGQSGLAFLLVSVSAIFLHDFDLTILSYLFSLLFSVLLSIYFTNILGGFKKIFSFDVEVRKILYFSLPMMMVVGSQYIISWTDIFMLSLFERPVAVGRYQIVYQTSVILLLLMKSANSIFPAIVSDLYDQNNIGEIESIYTVFTKWTLYLSSILYVTIFVFSLEILGLFGSEFQDPRAVTALYILTTSQLIVVAVGSVGHLLAMIDYERLQLVNTIAVSSLNILLNYYFIQWYGIVGAASATGLSVVVLNLIGLVEINYLVGIHPFSESYWKGALSLACSLPVTLFIYSLGLGWIGIILCLIFTPIVFMILMLLLGLDENDTKLISSVRSIAD